MMEESGAGSGAGTGAGSVLVTNGSGKPKNIRNLRIRTAVPQIRNTDLARCKGGSLPYCWRAPPWAACAPLRPGRAGAAIPAS
jgi:hypothetical protein